MKHALLCASVLAGLLLLAGLPQIAHGQSLPEPRQSPLGLSRIMLDDDSYVKIVYGRPQVREREIFGQLIPFGEIWRTGANEATEITVTEPVLVEGNRLDDGTYSLFTIPKQDSWTVIFNRQLGSWGAYSYEEDADVMRTEVPVQRTNEPVEAFTIMFEQQEGEEQAKMVMKWENTQVELMLQPAQ